MRRLFIASFFFASAALVAGETKQSADDYELRGFFGKDAATEISLRRTGAEQSRWYRLREKADGILVEKADAKNGTATIVVNGGRITLRLAGESVTEPEKEKSARSLRDWKTLIDYFGRWDQSMRIKQRAMMDQSAVALGKSHPEYFTEEGSGTPAAKAAILRIMKESITAGIMAADKDSPAIPPPENLSALIENAYGDISINLHPSLPEGTTESTGTQSQVMTIHGHARKVTVTGATADSDQVKETFEHLRIFYVGVYFSDLQHGLLSPNE